MRNFNPCPKCNSNNILRIPSEDMLANTNYINCGFISHVFVTRYICCNCGYSEEWIDNKEDIRKLYKEYKTK